MEEPTSATPDSDSKTLSSGESSEEEEDERVAAEKECESPSILPSSVLDQASAIAQHFTNSIKRGSVGQDDARSLGCPSPRLPSRTGSSLSLSLSLSAESADRPPQLNSISSEPPETFAATDLTLLSSRDDSIFDPDRSIRRRRDSTLSKQDQLLIGKIKSYYENAGNQDTTFSLQRRESLTYIPTGLVRSSVSRFDSIPKDDPVQTNQPGLTTSPCLDAPSADSALFTETGGNMVSSHSLDSLKSDQFSTDSGEHHWFGSQSVHDNLSEDEEFRPSSEMIKVWKAMEQQISRSQSEDRVSDPSREAPRPPSVSNPTKSRCPESEVSDLSTITEETWSPSPLRTNDQTKQVNQTGSLRNARRVFGEEAVVLRATVPRVAQLRAEAGGGRPSEDSDQLDDVDMAKSKVLHLARQYSQRIKTTKPVVRQRSQGLLIGKKSLACVVEEKESSGNNIS